MRIALITDAWHPQVNGVVMTLSTTVSILQRMGHEVLVIEPTQFKTFPCPTYSSIRLAWLPHARINKLLTSFIPDAIHIATEGTLGWSARSWCLTRHIPFTTSYHTQFPEYLQARYPIPLGWSYAALRRFHAAAKRIMVATPSLERTLRARHFPNLVRWSRGVDVERFRPNNKSHLELPRPIALYTGRVAVEKNIEAFLDMEWHGSKVIVGDGPARSVLEQKYSNATFLGYRHGEELARIVATADVFVFPSRTDTFGLVLLEAMACGVPVAAFPVIGPIDVVQPGVTGILDENLSRAAYGALRLDPNACREQALRSTWQSATDQFLNNLCSIHAPQTSARALQISKLERTYQ